MGQLVPRRSIQLPAALPGVEVHRGWHPGGSICSGFRAQYLVGMMDGPLRYQSDGQSHELAGQYVVLVLAEEFRPGYILGALGFRHWYIEPEVMRQAAEERGQRGTPRFAKVVVEDPRTYHALVLATKALAKATSALEQQETLTGVLDFVLGEYSDPRPAGSDIIVHRAVRRMRDLILDRYDEELSLETLASHAGLNKFYALREFKRLMGTTPQAYQRHVRVGKAREMLRAGSSSSDVAHALGFCDQSHFVRTFRQLTFTTPRRYQSGA